MSLGTASYLTQRCVCALISMVIAVAVAIGPGTSAAASLGGGMAPGAVRDVALQSCQAEVPGLGSGQACDGEMGGATGYAACPMMGLCVNMSSGPTHCGLLGLTQVAGFDPDNIAVATVRYLRTEVQASGLPAEPRFHPPIL